MSTAILLLESVPVGFVVAFLTSFMLFSTGDQHFNAISALHKSIRGSNVDGALYWLGRMLEAGELVSS